jgi:hypothetical protein
MILQVWYTNLAVALLALVFLFRKNCRNQELETPAAGLVDDGVVALRYGR